VRSDISARFSGRKRGPRREHRGNSSGLACGQEVGEMFISYELYQADHIRTAREQREEDIRTGELAADFGRLWHSLTPRRAVRQSRFRRARTAPANVACSVPSCRPTMGHRH